MRPVFNLVRIFVFFLVFLTSHASYEVVLWGREDGPFDDVRFRGACEAVRRFQWDRMSSSHHIPFSALPEYLGPHAYNGVVVPMTFYTFCAAHQLCQRESSLGEEASKVPVFVDDLFFEGGPDVPNPVDSKGYRRSLPPRQPLSLETANALIQSWNNRPEFLAFKRALDDFILKKFPDLPSATISDFVHYSQIIGGEMNAQPSLPDLGSRWSGQIKHFFTSCLKVSTFPCAVLRPVFEMEIAEGGLPLFRATNLKEFIIDKTALRLQDSILSAGDLATSMRLSLMVGSHSLSFDMSYAGSVFTDPHASPMVLHCPPDDPSAFEAGKMIYILFAPLPLSREVTGIISTPPLFGPAALFRKGEFHHPRTKFLERNYSNGNTSIYAAHLVFRGMRAAPPPMVVGVFSPPETASQFHHLMAQHLALTLPPMIGEADPDATPERLRRANEVLATGIDGLLRGIPTGTAVTASAATTKGATA